MKEEQTVIGALLKLQRIKQERTQKDVSYGICVPSYLSKIEYGTVKPDEEILEKLFKKLGINYLRNGSVLEELKKKIENYYKMIHYELKRKELYQELQKTDDFLSYSELAIPWLLVKKGEGELVNEYLELLKPNMTLQQRAYNEIISLDEQNVTRENIWIYENAARTINNSFAMVRLCHAYFYAGSYNSIHELENKVVAMALEEGNVYQLASYYFMNGSAYACLNMEEMMMVNYNRGINLIQNTGWANTLYGIYYNIGATCISLHKYDLALEYLFKVKEEAQRYECDFLVLHRIALTYIRMGNLSKGKEFLDILRMELLKEQSEDCIEYLMYKESCFECEKGFLKDKEYLILLEKLIYKIKKESHFGFLYFYKDVITEAYINQRKYKKAFDFQQEISSVAIKNSF